MASNQNPYGISPKAQSGDSTQNKQFAPEKNNGYAIASMILGILSIFFSIIAALPGIILGHMARSRIKHNPTEYEGSGMALTGLILSYLMLIVFLFVAGLFTYLFLFVPEFSEEFKREFNRGMSQGL